MQNRWFGDPHDQFKYDLLAFLISALLGVRRLTMIWMLNRDGGPPIAFKPDPTRPAIAAYLKQRFEEGRTEISAMAGFFQPMVEDYYSYGDSDPDYLRTNPGTYMHGIPDGKLREAIVFLDPDTGMQPPSARGVPKPEHLGYGQLGNIVDRMNGTSVAIVFQCAWRREESRITWPKVCGLIRNGVKLEQVAYAGNKVVSCYALSKSSSVMEAVVASLTTYASHHDLFVGACPSWHVAAHDQ